MCGIAGWIGKIKDKELQAQQVIEAMFHRGPDAQQALHWEQVSLIHNRLKIIDLSENATQPMSNEDNSVWIVFNGEIYNHQILRKQLIEKGHIFKSHSDTEVIIHLYEEHGNDFPKFLKGMFAICIYDIKKSKILFCRDRYGIKPLFIYSKDNSIMAFASELNSLKIIREVDLEINKQAIYDFTAFFYVPAPDTLYRYIRCLMPGTTEVLHINSGNIKPDNTIIWHTSGVNINNSLQLEEAAAKAEELLESAVKSQLESDVNLGSLLSGGIDSSLVSYYAQKNIAGKLNTYNVKFPDEQYDESWAALAVAEAIRSNHSTLIFETNTGSWESITSLLLHTGQPYADTSIFAMHSVSKLMRQNVTVALSGDGGDEAFGGYTFYKEIEPILQFNNLPSFLTGFMVNILKPLSFIHQKVARINRVLEHFHQADEIKITENFFRWIREPDHRMLWDNYTHYEPVRRHFEECSKKVSHLPAKSLERLSALTTLVNIDLTLLNDFLPKVDTASMKESLEVRVPMLDEELFDFGMTLPHRLKTSHKELKHVLRAVARRQLPAKVANKPKWGFAIPVDVWVQETFKLKTAEYLLHKNSPLKEYLNQSIYESWVRDFCFNLSSKNISREGLYQRVIMLLSLSLHLDTDKLYQKI